MPEASQHRGARPGLMTSQTKTIGTEPPSTGRVARCPGIYPTVRVGGPMKPIAPAISPSWSLPEMPRNRCTRKPTDSQTIIQGDGRYATHRPRTPTPARGAGSVHE